VRDTDESLAHIEEAFGKMGGLGLAGVCIDVAHGHHARVADLVTVVKRVYGNDLVVIAGNVATREGTRFLYEAGADVVKVGIGAGSVCTTRTVAGVGVPQLSAIMDCASFATPRGLPIIADGGIRHSGDIAKAIAAGATTVMLGNLLAGTDETPGEMFLVDGVPFKKYRGQASFGSNGERYVKEGIEGMVPSKGPVAQVLEQLQAGLRSAMSYVGARTILEFQGLADFVEVSPHTLTENSVRVTEKL
jgi:IMP dehydrogenase